jgi:predicted small metal-binding protein
LTPPGTTGDDCAPSDQEALMTQVVHCPCGTDVRGESDDDIVSAVEQHVQDEHPDMVGKMDRKQILEMAEQA